MKQIIISALLVLAGTSCFAAAADICGKPVKLEPVGGQDSSFDYFNVTLDSGKKIEAVGRTTSFVTALGSGLTLCFKIPASESIYEITSISK
jgi:hypothetical protein